MEEVNSAQFQTIIQQRYAEEFFRGLLEAAPDAIVIIDQQGLIVMVNRQTEQLFGYDRNQLLGESIDCLLPTRLHLIHAHHRDQYLTDPRTRPMGQNLALQAQRADGSEFPVEVSLSPLQTQDNLFVISAIRDITHQKRLEAQILQQNRELLETTAFTNNILESSTEYSIIATDLDGRILAWNGGARLNYGYQAEEMVGKQHVAMLHVPEDVQSGKAQTILTTAYQTGKAEGVVDRIRKDGSRFTASISMTLRKDTEGSPIGYVLISKDITEQTLLEDEVQRKSDELAEQYRRAQEANRLKSEFLANMSHELRTPLNAIIGFSELMHDQKVGPVSAEQKEYLGDILTSSQHLLQLINDVLDLSKIEAGKIDLRPELVDMQTLVAEVRDVVRMLSAKKHIRVEMAIAANLGQIVLDPAKLKQVLYNYLSNALKFTADGGRVQIVVRPEDATHFRLEVKDTGIGIQPADIARLFVEFQQLDASIAKKYQGTGLGLALTKRIVEMQMGRVGVDSTPGQGSTFFAILPCISEHTVGDTPSSLAGEQPPRNASAAPSEAAG